MLLGGGYARDEKAILVTVVALSNTYGLVFIVFLLGYGLVELPKQMWMVRVYIYIYMCVCVCVCVCACVYGCMYAYDLAIFSGCQYIYIYACIAIAPPTPSPPPPSTQNGNLQGKLRRLQGKAAHEFRALSDATMDMSEAVAHALKTKGEVLCA